MMKMKIKNLYKLEQSIKEIKNYFHSQKFNIALTKIGKENKEETKNRINKTQSDFEGNKWAKLSPVTVKIKGHSKIWYDSGNTLNSIIYDVGKWGVKIGTTTNYSKFVHYGTQKMPARPLIGMGQNEINKYIDYLLDDIKDIVTKV